MADPPTSASGDPASGADANAHDLAALVVEYINNNPEPGNNPAAVTLIVNSQEHQNDDYLEEEDVDPFSLLFLHQHVTTLSATNSSFYVEPSWLTKIIQCCLYKLFRD
jgi:hypothetical protein